MIALLGYVLPFLVALCAAPYVPAGLMTLVGLSSPYEGWLDFFARSGLWGYVAPMFGSASWQHP